MPVTEDICLAQILTTLAHKRRVKIFRILMKNKNAGTFFSQLEAEANLCHSSLIHHLRVMERGGLLSRQSVGSRTKYRLSLTVLKANLSALLGKIAPPVAVIPQQPQLKIK